MKLTSFTDYSLRVLIYLAADPARRATIAEIAAVYEISEHHLVKVAHFLGKCGWVSTTRGKGGGLELAAPPETIVIGDVVRRTEGDSVLAECFGEQPSQCAIAGACRLRGVLSRALDAFYAVLDECTLAQLAANPQQLSRIFFVDSPRRAAA